MIVGAGVIGLSTAFYLAKEGAQVTVLDKNSIASEASAINGGLIVPTMCAPEASPHNLQELRKWFFRRTSPVRISLKPNLERLRWIINFWQAARSALYVRRKKLMKTLGEASLQLYTQLASEEDFNFDLTKNGALEVFQSAKEFQEAVDHAKELRQEGYRVRVLDAKEILDLEPVLAPKFVGGIFHMDAIQAHPKKFAQCLADSIRKIGGKILENVSVDGFRTTENRISSIVTSSEEVECDAAVLCAGPWSKEVAKRLHLYLPIQPGKGYMLLLDSTEAKLKTSLEFAGTRVFVAQQADGMLRAVGSLELMGFNRTIPRRIIERMRNVIAEGLPVYRNSTIIETRTAFRPCAPDGLPVIGRTNRYENLFVGTGHCRLGFTLAPITGKLLSELVLNGDPSVNIGELTPSRFA